MREPIHEVHRPPQLDAITVEYEEHRRTVRCFCGEQVPRSIVPHLKAKHTVLWDKWTEYFVLLRGKGYPLKRIMRLFKSGDGRLLFSWTVIERAIRNQVETGKLTYLPPPKSIIKRWNPNGFKLQTTTVWDFSHRGDWSVHMGDYRGNWPPQIPRNLIERYTHKGELLIDAFVGGGTTLIEAWILGRRSIGLDISQTAIQTTEARLREMEEYAEKNNSITLDPGCRPRVLKGNALELNEILAKNSILPGEVKLICAHPPYLDSIKYTVDDRNDLALISSPCVFCDRLRVFASEAHAILPVDGICALLIGDVRKRGKTIPLGFRVLGIFETEGFEINHIVVKMQHKDRSSEFYIGSANIGLLLAHEYLLIMRSK